MVDLVERACAVPLIERLRRVPKDGRLIYEHSPTCSSITPVGLLSHEAADAIEGLERGFRMHLWNKLKAGGVKDDDAYRIINQHIDEALRSTLGKDGDHNDE